MAAIKIKKNFENVANSFALLRSENMFCDVNLIVENKVFPCHKLVLSASSDYFMNMFNGSFVEHEKKDITIHDVTAEVFANVLDFIYCQEISVDENNLEGILGASCMFLLSELKESCVKFCETMICDANFVFLTDTAELYDLDDLMKKCIDWIVSKFKHMEESSFLSLSSHTACKVLSSKELSVSNEVEVGKAVLKWLKANPEHASQDIEKMVSAIRLAECDTLFVKSVLMESDLIKKSVETIAMLSLFCEQKSYGLYFPKEIPIHFPRRSTGLRFQLLVLCRLMSLDERLRRKEFETTWIIDENGNAMVFDHCSSSSSLGGDTWRKTIDGQLSSCMNNDTLFISGRSNRGGNNESKLMRYNSSTRAFDKCQSIPVARIGYQLVSGPIDTIFAVGGHTLTDPSDRLTRTTSTDIHQYNAKYDKWELLRDDSKAVIFDDDSTPCFFFMNCIIVVSQFGEIYCIDINKNYMSHTTVSEEATRESVLGKLCSTQVRSIAVVTKTCGGFRDDNAAVFVLIDLEQIIQQHRQRENANCPDAESGSSNPDKAVTSAAVRRNCHLSFNEDRCNVVALCTCGPLLLALTRTRQGDIVLFSCIADDFVCGTSYEWRLVARQTAENIGFPLLDVEYARFVSIKTANKELDIAIL